MLALTNKLQKTSGRSLTLLPTECLLNKHSTSHTIDTSALHSRILLIDDNVSLIDNHRRLFNTLGFFVDVVGSTIEALQLPFRQYAAILIRDKLPAINAFLIIRIIRADLSKKEFPKIFSICKKKECSIENLAYYFAFGANDFLQLPLKLPVLQRKLKLSDITIPQKGVAHEK
ncbi:response regulator transcription factor [Candidatus Dependentiae bacterium]|nr:response regulator transcription factor [Candidatus Dependentiae bacterium]